MAKRKRKAFKVTLVPEGGGIGENGRPLIRVSEVYAESEAGAREYATEQAMAEAEEHGRPIYQIVSVEPV